MAMLPPYRDPELRRAFALPRDEQCALLMRMAGESVESVKNRKRGTFTSHPIRVRRTAAALSVVAPPFPLTVVNDADSHELKIIVEHNALSVPGSWSNRHAPRTPAAIEDLEKVVIDASDTMGVWVLPFQATAWTRASVRRLIDTLASYLPAEGRGGDVPLHVSWHSKFTDHLTLCVERNTHEDTKTIPGSRGLADRGFSVEVRFQKAIEDRVMGDWYKVFNRDKGASLPVIDEHLNECRPKGAAAKRSTRRLYDEDDPDMDFIERAARRALHGNTDGDDIESLEDGCESIQQQIEALQKRIQDLLDR